MWLDRLGTKTVTVLFLKTAIALPYAAEMLHGYFPFHHTKYEKDILSGGDLMKLIVFTTRGHS